MDKKTYGAVYEQLVTDTYEHFKGRYPGSSTCFVGINNSINACFPFVNLLLSDGSLQQDDITGLWIERTRGKAKLNGIVGYNHHTGRFRFYKVPDKYSLIRRVSKFTDGKDVVIIGDDSVTSGVTIKTAKRFLEQGKEQLGFNDIYTLSFISSDSSLVDSPTLSPFTVLRDRLQSPYGISGAPRFNVGPYTRDRPHASILRVV